MGAFYLNYNRTEHLAGSIKTMQNRGFSKYDEFVFGKYSLVLFRKQLCDVKNFIHNEDEGIYCTGTPVYKSLDYENSLHTILGDFKSGNLDLTDLLGQYFILIRIKETLFYLHDPLSLHSVYYNPVENEISSSFLALCLNSSFEINKTALIENIICGYIIGEETIHKEIQRIGTNSELHSLNLEKISPGLPSRSFKTKNTRLKEIEEQLSGIRKYFDSLKSLGNKYRIFAGITGGFDSRLILSEILRSFDRYHFYSHWRETESIDFSIAREICEREGIPFHYYQSQPQSSTNEEMIKSTLSNAMLHYDGQIRTESFWTEIFNTRKYKEEVTLGKCLEINGIGGEQYRNVERLIYPYYLLNSWIKEELIYKNPGRCFIDNSKEKEFITSYSKKVRRLLGIKNRIFIRRNNMSVFYNEILNPALRTVRNNADNQLFFSLSPFVEPIVSFPAYRIQYLKGLGNQFEADMITTINPSIAKYRSNYGFSLNNREPIKNKMVTIIKNMVPLRIYNNRFRKMKYFRKQYSLKNNPVFDHYLSELKQLDLPLDLERISHNDRLQPLLLSAGYLISFLKQNANRNTL